MCLNLISFFGDASLGFALCSALWGAFKSSLVWPRLAAVFLIFSLSILLFAHISDEFSLADVALHSHALKPFLYKICGVWGYHEGSFLLLMVMYGCVIACLPYNENITRLSCFVLSGFILLMIFHIRPFLPLLGPAETGQDLNPVLQDQMLAIHPPILYMGHALLVGLFLISLTEVENLKRYLQKIAQISWCFLTLGILLGSFWAYHELGWGGVWFFDPVENLSLLPWLAVTVLLHCLRFQRSDQLIRFLGVMAFLLSLLSCFLMRSGLVTSVHNFAYSEGFLFYFGGYTFFLTLLGAYGLWIMRLSPTTPVSLNVYALIHITTFFVFGMILLLGTLYPVLSSLFTQRTVVGESFYQAVLTPFFMIIPIAASWQSIQKDSFFTSLVALLSLAFSLYLCEDWPITAHLFHIVAWITVVMTIKHISFKLRTSMFFAHAGLGVMMLGLIYSHFSQKEFVISIASLKKSIPLTDTIQAKLVKAEDVPASNYTAQQFFIEIEENQKQIGSLVLERRSYFVSKLLHHESGTFTKRGIQWYGQLLETSPTALEIQIMKKPFVFLIWLGGVLMIFGFLIRFLLKLKLFFMKKSLLSL